MSHKFYGGVHPAEHKEATERKPVIPLEEAPAQVVIPMSMHVGAPCKPIVAVGDQVTVGQKIGEIAGLGAPIHASVSGKVVAVEPRPHPGGGTMMSVVIENDFQDTPCDTIRHRDNVDALTPQEIIDIVKEAGITGMGGAGFPTHVKLSGAVGKVDTILINGAECEPYITADHRLMLERGEAVLGGVGFIMKALGLQEATIGIEGNKLDAVEHLKSLLPAGSGIHIETLKTRYPQGAKKQIILAVTGREVAPGARTGALFNVTTVYSICRAVYEGLPITEKVVTVTGEGAVEPKNMIVRVGTPIGELLEAAGGVKEETCKVVGGGPMMGTAQGDLSVPVVKGTNAVLCMVDAAPAAEDPTCIRCGKCVKACSMNLLPTELEHAFDMRDARQLEKLKVNLCVNCGACSFVCPAKRNLAEKNQLAKAFLREQSTRKGK